jgi:hypothetical protein
MYPAAAAGQAFGLVAWDESERAHAVGRPKMDRHGHQRRRRNAGADQDRVEAEGPGAADVGLELIADHDHLPRSTATQGLREHRLVRLA